MFYLSMLFIFSYVVIISSFFDDKIKNNLFFMMIFLIFLISALRFGLGTDYFGYMWHYEFKTTPSILDAINYQSNIGNFDVGYRILSSIFKYLNLEFYHMVFFITLIIFVFYGIIIKNFSKNKVLSLFIFFTMYYLVYVLSALRQGIAMSIFFIAYFMFLKERKYLKYTLTILFASLFHKVILITLILVIVRKYDYYFLYNRYINIIFVIVAVLLSVIRVDTLLIILGKVFNIYKLQVYEGQGINIISLLIRIFFLILVLSLYKVSYKNKLEEFDKFQVYTYFIGVIIYISISNNQIYSRMTDIFMIIDIILIPNLIFYTRIKKPILSLIPFILILGSIFFIKDMSADLYQGDFYNKNLINYPYISIFNKDKIEYFRDTNLIDL